jgi:phosphoglycolate phosphatase-like HAD superfamily hydrolase
MSKNLGIKKKAIKLIEWRREELKKEKEREEKLEELRLKAIKDAKKEEGKEISSLEDTDSEEEDDNNGKGLFDDFFNNKETKKKEKKIKKEEEKKIKNTPKLPYLYIDYSDDSLKEAEKYGYSTFKIDKKTGITKEQINNLLSNKIVDLSKNHIVINLWKVLTKSNLTSASFDTSGVDIKKFTNQFEEKLKWGSYLSKREELSANDRKKYSLFRDNIEYFLKRLKEKNVRVFIISNAHYSFVESIFNYYELNQYIEKIYTPSQCGLPSSYKKTFDSFPDTRIINKLRIFVCIERHVGRLLF